MYPDIRAASAVHLTVPDFDCDTHMDDSSLGWHAVHMILAIQYGATDYKYVLAAAV